MKCPESHTPGVFVCLDCTCSNWGSSPMRSNDGKNIAKDKGVHREMTIDLSLHLSKNLRPAG